MATSSAFHEDMENLAPPPPPEWREGDAVSATEKDKAEIQSLALEAKTIAAAAAAFVKSCEGGDSYDNNCAHFLSNAFLKAGFDDLKAPANCINARCGTSAKRPIRARDMWCWFQEKATKTANALPENDGFWAVFQLDEAQYWGGHVIIYDSDKKVYYGTGHYPQWAQHCYKW